MNEDIPPSDILEMDTIISNMYKATKVEEPAAPLPDGKVMVMLDREEYEKLKNRTLGKRRKKARVKPKPLPVSYERVLNIVRTWESIGLTRKAKFFFILAYLTGARVSEVLQLRRMDFDIEEIDGQKYLAIQLLTLKESRDNPLRKIIIATDGYEQELTKMFVNEYLNVFHDKEKLFNFSRKAAWRYLSKINIGPIQGIVPSPTGAEIRYFETFPCHPHFMRHCRITHLKKKYNFDDQYLMMWAGWASTRMATEYVHLSAEDMARKIRTEMERTTELDYHKTHNQQSNNPSTALALSPSSEPQP